MDIEQNVDPEEKWDEFMKWLKSHSDNWVFRGVSDNAKHLLVPTIGRGKDYSLEKEINLFEHFKLKANLFSPKVYSDFEWIVLAQHHGLHTRLLDWTFNPLVAAFFAVTQNPNLDGRIYSLQPSVSSFLNLSKEKSPFELDRIKFLIPPVSSRRIELQKGLFSIHPQANKPSIIVSRDLIEMENAYKGKSMHITDTRLPKLSDNEYSYHESYYAQHAQYIFDVPSSCKLSFENNIRALGVDETFFGDIDSISRHLNHQLKSRKIPEIYTPTSRSMHANFKKLIDDQVVEALSNSPDIFVSDLQAVFINPNDIVITIEDIKEGFLGKEIKGKVRVLLISNLSNDEGLFQEKEPVSYKSMNQFFHFFRQLDKDVQFFWGTDEIELTFDGEINEFKGETTFSLYNLNLTKLISEQFIQQTILYRKHCLLLSSADRELIETLHRDSEGFKNLIEIRKNVNHN